MMYHKRMKILLGIELEFMLHSGKEHYCILSCPETLWKAEHKGQHNVHSILQGLRADFSQVYNKNQGTKSKMQELSFLLFHFIFNFSFILVCRCFVYLYVCALCVCAVLEKARREYQPHGL